MPKPAKNTLWLMLLILTISSCTQKEKPNIIWIFSDDHSYQTIGAYGGRLQSLNPTPNLDRIASEGMRFDRCYVENSICAPSRATLLTGKMSHLHGKSTNTQKTVFDHNQQQFQKILRQNGYQTAMIGKIHLAGNMQGFDYWEVLIGQGSYKDPTLLSEDGEKQYTGYTTDIITDKSLDWLKNKRDQKKPFMMMVHHKAPHRAWVPKRDHMDLYEEVDIPEPDNLFDDYHTRTLAAHEQTMGILQDMTMDRDLKLVAHENPRFTRTGIDDRFDARRKKYENLNLEGEELLKFKYQIYMQDYLRCIYSVDENIGRVLDYLKENGMDKNTIVMYSSDQGFYMGEHGWFDKRFMYEESFRTPLIVKWPGTVQAGSVNTDLVQNIDFAETFLDIAGAPIPADMQGKSLVPLLTGKTPRDWRKSLYYHYYEYPGAHSVRKHEGVANKRYKLIRFYGEDVPGGEEWEFYDLQTDPAEMNNLYGNAEVENTVAEMKKELIRLRDQYSSPGPEVRTSLPLLVGTFTDGDSKGIYALDFDSNTGALTNKKLLVEQENPSYLDISEDRSRVYASSGANRGLISVFGWNEDQSQLIELGNYPSEGKGACFIELSAKEDLLAVANYATGTIAVYPLNPDGEVSGEVQARQHTGSGPFLPNQKSAHAHCTKFDAMGNYLYAVDLGIDQVLAYPITAKGKLGEPQLALTMDPGDGPRHLIFHPTKNMAFVINELSSSVVSASLDPKTGVLRKIDKASTLPADFKGKSNCADIHISADGRYLYASNRGHNSIAIFSVGDDGSLQLLANESVRGDWPRNFTLSPDGKFLLVANRRSNNIVVFQIDPNSGLLSFTGHQISVPGPVCLKFD